jgi:hypothetical protein
MKFNPESAKKYYLFLFLLITEMLVIGRLVGENRPSVLIGVGTGGEKQPEKFSHFYLLDSDIVDMVYGSGDPILSRAYVVKTTQTECPPGCPPPEKTGPSCWRCCDGTWVCTDDDHYAAILESSARAQKKWPDYKNRLNDIKGWPAVEAQLALNPPREISKTDPRVISFLKNMGMARAGRVRNYYVCR